MENKEIYDDKFDDVVKALKKAYEDGTLNEAIDAVFDIIFEDVIDIRQNHLGTFAEFKNVDEFDRPPLPDDVISRSSCAWSTCDIQEAIRRAREYEDKSKRRGHGARSRNTRRPQ